MLATAEARYKRNHDASLQDGAQRVPENGSMAEVRLSAHQFAYNRFMALKVFDLECENGHVFEGWFSSHEDYEGQVAGGLLTCPLCNSQSITRRVSAARLNVARSSDSTASAQARERHEEAEARARQLQAEFIRHMRETIRSSEDVGERFAVEARRIHEGEAPQRVIRGVATQAEREALIEDGIPVMPVPAFLDDDRLQ